MLVGIIAGSQALRVSPPVMRLGVASRQLDVSHGCGGAAPFAPFTGSGSGGDQSQYAPGGQWTQYAQGVVVPAGLARMPPSNADETRAVTSAPVIGPAVGAGSPGCWASASAVPEVPRLKGTGAKTVR